MGIKPIGSLEDRFWVKVNKTKTCWNWIGSKTNKINGYGVLYFNKCGQKFKSAHRISYEIHKGKIPDGLQIDHLCRNTFCVNPDHLEAVTQRENQLRGFGWSGINARKTRCKHGHEFTQENTIIRPNNGRECRSCSRIRKNKWQIKSRHNAFVGP